MVSDQQVGVVAVPSNPPPVSVALRELGPTLTWFGLGLLGLGTTLTALFVFRPAHKRLRTLEHAARALGEGRTDVRATEAGGDEVSSLARTFNRMAIDLDSRATALLASDRVRRQLLADVSHELMTPLSAIRGYVETLGMADVPLDQDTRSRYLGIVEQETHKLEAIIGDLLDLARLEGGGDGCAPSRLPLEICSSGSPIVTNRCCGTATSRSISTSPRARRGFSAMRLAWSRRFRTSRPMHSPHASAAASDSRLRLPPTRLSGSPCAIRDPAFRLTTCRVCLIGSTRWMPHAPGRRCRRAAA